MRNTIVPRKHSLSGCAWAGGSWVSICQIDSLVKRIRQEEGRRTSRGDGEMGRWGDGEMERWGDGEMGREGRGTDKPLNLSKS